MDSPAAIRDAIERVEVWNLRTGQVNTDLRCDAEVTSALEGGWSWARSKTITPGYRSLAMVRIRENSSGFGSTYPWDREAVQVRRLPGECAAAVQPAFAVSADGRRLVVVCNKDLGHARRV